MADQLCTPAQVKARLQTSAGGVTFSAADDTLISEIIDQVTSFAEGYTGRKFAPEAAATYVFDTVYGNVLHIPRGIRTITSMGVASTHQPDSAGTYTSIPAADRLLRPKSADLMIGWPYTQVQITRGTVAGTVRYFSNAENGCTITGDFGFATVPADMQAVGMDAAVAAFQSRKNGASGVIGADDTAVVPWSQYFSKGSPQRATLDRYRVYAI